VILWVPAVSIFIISTRMFPEILGDTTDPMADDIRLNNRGTRPEADDASGEGGRYVNAAHTRGKVPFRGFCLGFPVSEVDNSQLEHIENTTDVTQHWEVEHGSPVKHCENAGMQEMGDGYSDAV
jgi:hypothetical protein